MANPIIRFVESVCVQTAVYWGSPNPDGYGGYSYDAPVEVLCRWDDKVQMVRDSRGDEVVSNAEIMVAQDLAEGGMMHLGKLTELTESQKNNPLEVPQARIILRLNRVPLFRSKTEFIYTVFLGGRR